MTIIKVLLTAVLFSVVYACSTASESQTVFDASVKPATPSESVAAPSVTQAADGLALYAKNCAFCHKENGTGGKMQVRGKEIDPADLTTDKVKKLSDEKFARYIKNGFPDDGMPAFKDKLNDEQITAIIKYIRTELQK